MYVYEPDFKDPHRELEVSMNFYRDLVKRLHFWDLMEFVNYLSARDGVDWAIEQLGRGNVDPAVLAEIGELDTRLRANADYLVNDLELYRHIRRDEPEEYWWWYLDGSKPDGLLETREEEVWEWKPVAAPAMALAEKREEYRSNDKHG